MKTFIITTFIFITSFISSCLTPDDPEPAALPPLTTEGKNTFGCLIDGRVFLPGKRELGAQILSIFFEQNSLQLQAKAGKESVSVICNNITTEGTYNIPPPPSDGKMYTNNEIGSTCWPIVKLENSKIIITYFDKTARIISGTFEYLNMKPKFASCDTTKVINITEGRFDVKF
jgi:hypothetical protein